MNKLSKEKTEIFIGLVEIYKNAITDKCKCYSNSNDIFEYSRIIESKMHNILVYFKNDIYPEIDENVYQEIDIKLNLMCNIQGYSNAFDSKNDCNEYAYYNIHTCLIERIVDLIRYCKNYL